VVLDFRILGPLEVVADAGPVALGGARQRATLAILLLSANRVVSVDRLAEDLYAGAAPVTAVTQVQRQVSELRKALGATAIETRPPGYRVRVTHDGFDLHRFERAAAEGSRALAESDAQRAADLLREALALWRGPPLADFGYHSFAQGSVERLEEMRLAAVEDRIDADLALGRHADLVGELEELVGEQQLRERPRGQLMLALYRSGRQAEALDVYRGTREALVREFGIEPSPDLQTLERAILNQDPALAPSGGARSSLSSPRQAERSLLVVSRRADDVDGLLALAQPLATRGHELIVTRLVADAADLEPAARALNARRKTLTVRARAAAFTSADPAADIARLGTIHDAVLVLLDAPPGLDSDRLPDEVARVLERSPADVAILSHEVELNAGEGIFVPFGGGEHEWAALELGAWLADATGAVLKLVGTKADERAGRRDASRLLADASLAVQRVVGVETEPILAEATEESLVAAVNAATVIAVGISPRWRRDGIGVTRRALVRKARPPVLLVQRGPCPGGLAPPESRTRFTWSLESS